MQALIKLAEMGSMRRAARAMNMTQPAVSQLVAELERLLETELFFRHARGVEPTDAARDLLPVAERVLKALLDGSEAVANRLQEQGGVVRVGASTAAIGGLLFGRLDSFVRRHPDIEVVITEFVTTEPLLGAADGSLDLVCTREPAVCPEGWEFRSCLEDRLIVIASVDHPVTRIPDPGLEELGRHKWLLNHVGTVARARFEDLAEKGDWPASARCRLVMHVPRLTYAMVASGEYLSVMPRSVAVPWLGDGVIVEVRCAIDMPLEPLGYLWKGRRAGPATAKFASFLDKSLAQTSADPVTVLRPM